MLGLDVGINALTLSLLVFLLVMAFMAGLVDAAVGGGGLIQIPALFGTLTQIAPASLLGTNKFASVFGTASAAWRYSHQVDIAWRSTLPAAVAAFIGSWEGAQITSLLPAKWMRPLVLVLLIAMAIYSFRKNELGVQHMPRWQGQAKLVFSVLAGFFIGFYDGFFGPGTGMFLLFVWVRFFGYDFLHAAATSKVINAATNAAALCYFVPHGYIVWFLAVAMACANLLGAQLGARVTIKYGAAFVRKLFLALVCALIAKMAWQIVIS